MQPLHILAIFFAFRHNEDCPGIDVDDRGRADANFRIEVFCIDIAGTVVAPDAAP